jgi:hypothetical protein
MPRQKCLTEQQRLDFNAPATDERTMVRYYTLSDDDLELVNQRRGDRNRLGFAMLFCYLRFPGRVLQEGEQPPKYDLDSISANRCASPILAPVGKSFSICLSTCSPMRCLNGTVSMFTSPIALVVVPTRNRRSGDRMPPTVGNSTSACKNPILFLLGRYLFRNCIIILLF